MTNLTETSIDEIDIMEFIDAFNDNGGFQDLFLEFSFSQNFLESLLGSIDQQAGNLPFTANSDVGIWLDALTDELLAAPDLAVDATAETAVNLTPDYVIFDTSAVWEAPVTASAADPILSSGSGALASSLIAPIFSAFSSSIDAAAVAGSGTEHYKLGFATYVDGSKHDLPRDIATDAEGNVYITGGTEAFDLIPITAGNDYYNANGPDNSGWFRPHDVFVHKYSPDGDLIWSTRIGGVNYDRAYAIEVDANGGVYVAGRAGDSFFTTDNAYQEEFGGNSTQSENRPYGPQDGFVSKLDAATGQLAWSTYFGGEGGEIVRDIDIGPDGVIHIAQTYIRDATGQHITGDALVPSFTGQTDDIYAQLSNDGSTLLYGTYLGGTGQTVNSANPAIIVDDFGDINMMMYTDETGAFTSANAWQSGPAGGHDLYVVKYDGATDGRTIKSATYFGTKGDELLETHNLAMDPVGNFIVSGETRGKFLPNTANGFQPNQGGGNTDGFISIISADATNVIASTFFGGSSRDLIEGIFYTDLGIFVTGTTGSSDLPVTDTMTFGGYKGGTDGFMALFSHDLSTLKYATYYGGSNDDAARAIHVSDTGDVYIGGPTRSDDLPLKDAEQPTKSTFFSAGFLAKFEMDDVIAPSGSAISITANARIDGGPAKAWILVNGAIVDEIEVSADHSQGETQTFAVDAGKILTSADTVEVRYYNDIYKPAQGLDRNLYVTDVSIDGTPLFLGNADLTGRHAAFNATNDTITLASNGGAVFQADGSVESVITLTASANLYKGAPIVEVYLNGTSIGKATVTADRDNGQSAQFDFGSKSAVEAGDVLEFHYVNDAYGGSAGDRNVYFDEIAIDNASIDMSDVQITARHGAYNQTQDFVVLASEGAAIFDLM